MKKILSIMLLSVLLLTSCTEPSIDTSSQDVSSEIVSQEGSEAPATIDELKQIFLQRFSNFKIMQSTLADIDSDGAEDYITIFTENDKGNKVAVIFADRGVASVGVTTGEDDNLIFVSNSLFVEDETIVFKLAEPRNIMERYEYRVQVKEVEKGYDTTISSKYISEFTEPEETEEDELDKLYIKKANESLLVENAKEIIDNIILKDEHFRNQVDRKQINFNFDSYPLIQMYEYTLEEYAETGKIEPRVMQGHYIYREYDIWEYEDKSGASLGIRNMIPFKDMVYTFKEMKTNPETMKVTLVEIADIGLYYYVDDGQTQMLIAANDVDGGYALDNSAMLLLYDTNDGKPYNCIILNDKTQLRAKGVVADDKEYNQIIYEEYTSKGDSPPTGGKDWNDKLILSKYFVKSCNLDENQNLDHFINPRDLQYFGQSNGWRIYHATYESQACDTAIIEKDLGGYKFYSSGIYYPSEVSIYAIKRKEVLTLEEAYEKGEIDIKEVHEFTPDEYKR